MEPPRRVRAPTPPIIHRHSHSPNPALDLILSYPFYRDLRAAMVRIVRASVRAKCSYLDNGLVHLHPPYPLLQTGCWCLTPCFPFRHNFKDCPNVIKPYPPIIYPSAPLLRCWHLDYESQKRDTQHMFCFNPEHDTKVFIEWHMLPRPERRGQCRLFEPEARAVEEFLQQYDDNFPARRVAGSFEERYDALCRLLADLRLPDAPEDFRLECVAKAERVHYILGWSRKPFFDCFDLLTGVVRDMAERRTENEVRRRRAARFRRAHLVETIDEEEEAEEVEQFEQFKQVEEVQHEAEIE